MECFIPIKTPPAISFVLHGMNRCTGGGLPGRLRPARYVVDNLTPVAIQLFTFGKQETEPAVQK